MWVKKRCSGNGIRFMGRDGNVEGGDDVEICTSLYDQIEEGNGNLILAR